MKMDQLLRARTKDQQKEVGPGWTVYDDTLSTMIQSVHVKTLNKPYIIFNFSIRVKNLEIIEMSYCAERQKL
jgi:hypothetical protein